MVRSVMVRIGKIMVRRMNSGRLSFAGRKGWERVMSRTQKVWKSGFTVERRRAITVDALEAVTG